MFTTIVGALYGIAVLLALGAMAALPAVAAAAYYRWRGRPMPAAPPLLFVLVLLGVGLYLISQS